MYGIVESVAEKINNLDSYYEMSNDINKTIAEEEKKIRIQKQLNTLKPFELKKLEKFLNGTGLLNYKRYFKEYLSSGGTNTFRIGKFERPT